MKKLITRLLVLMILFGGVMQYPKLIDSLPGDLAVKMPGAEWIFHSQCKNDYYGKMVDQLQEAWPDVPREYLEDEMDKRLRTVMTQSKEGLLEEARHLMSGVLAEMSSPEVRETWGQAQEAGSNRIPIDWMISVFQEIQQDEARLYQWHVLTSAAMSSMNSTKLSHLQMEYEADNRVTSLK